MREFFEVRSKCSGNLNETAANIEKFLEMGQNTFHFGDGKYDFMGQTIIDGNIKYRLLDCRFVETFAEFFFRESIRGNV